MTGSPESFWAEILSEEPARIQAVLRALGEAERQTTLAHLERMAMEEGWSEGQARRARSALAIAAAGSPVPPPPSEA
jgi:hypothetical protein